MFSTEDWKGLVRAGYGYKHKQGTVRVETRFMSANIVRPRFTLINLNLSEAR